MAIYAGTVTTSGNSEAIRLEKSLFRAHPEFGRHHNVRAVVIAPGQMLISLVDEAEVSEADEDPMLEAFLAFLEKDVIDHPARLQSLSEGSMPLAAELTKHIEVGDDEVFPDDIL